ncbi:hypothetical protein SLA2020_351060 [Shorea laevis]
MSMKEPIGEDAHGTGTQVKAYFKDLHDRLDAMAKTVNGGRGSMFKTLLERTNLPFTTKLMGFLLSPKFKMSQIEAHDGVGNTTISKQI